MKPNHKNFFNHPIFHLEQKNYLLFVLIIAPLFNFLSGTGIDLYSPSLPAIANFMGVSPTMAKNTITVTMIGFASSCLIFGPIIDKHSKRIISLFALIIFFTISLLATQVHHITILMLIRVIQGACIAVITVSSRALIMDHFKGHQLSVAIAYASAAYALGPIIGPALGGYVQHYFDWQANFILYAIFSGVIFILVVCFLQYSKKTKLSQQNSMNYLHILQNKYYVSGVLILGLVYTEQLIFPVLGPFIIEKHLGFTSVVYGQLALLVGLVYFIGTLCNRILLNSLSTHQVLKHGFSIVLIGFFVLVGCAFSFKLSIITLIAPIMVINFGLSFIFSNVLVGSLSLYPNNAGIASALQSFSLTTFSALSLFILSQFLISSLWDLVLVYAILITLQYILFYGVFSKIFKR